MTTTTPQLGASVLIPVLNEAAHLEDAVEAMRAQSFDGTYELIFIDGGSTDGSREILERLAAEDERVRVFENPQRRTPQALNIGLRESRGAVIVRMDAHTHYPPNYIADAVERLERGDVAHVSGPALPYEEGTPWSRRVALATTTSLGTGGASFRHPVDGDEIEVQSGFAGAWRRETLERHGGWDEGWPINQDAELAARIRAEGGRLVCLPSMAASYIPRDSLRALARQYFRYGLYRAKTSQRHGGSMRPVLLFPPLLFLVTLLSVLPHNLARAPRVGVAGYAVTTLVVALGAATPGRHLDALMLPAVFATMHLAWGCGFLVGCLRFGLPRWA
ncbi:MAG TPA: glycosyltransferase family 2 protein [Thermoleophilaceae bacterium]|nr:glycosyltransferase family 2 protein [Thermoleophilaceae bacterium]